MVLLQWFNNKIRHCFSSTYRGEYDEEYSIDFHLPDEILIEILSKLPADRLMVFKLVCHHWRVLISSYDLFKVHMKRVRDKNNSFGISRDHHFMLPSQLKLQNLGVNWKLCDALTYENDVDSCDGLLMLRKSRKFVIVNLITQETRIIRSPKNIGHRSCCIFFDRFEDDYKLLKVFPSSSQNDDDYIYSFKRDEWARVSSNKTKSGLLGCHDNPGPPVLVNDALHWMYRGLALVFKIESKDFFSPYPKSINIELYNEHTWDMQYNRLHLMEKDGKLCLYESFLFSEVIQIWVLQDYENWGSWERKLKVDLGHVSKKLGDKLNISCSIWGLSRQVEIVSFNENDILLVCWMFKRGLYLYNLKRKKIKVIQEAKFQEGSIIRAFTSETLNLESNLEYNLQFFSLESLTFISDPLFFNPLNSK